MLTRNEKKVLKYLLVHFDREFSINQIAKNCRLSPNGAYKILKKLEGEDVLKHKQVGNVKSYSINFAEKKTKLILQLLFMEKAPQELWDKFAVLQPVSEICIITASEKEAFIVAEKTKLPKVKGVKIHVIAQSALLAEKEVLLTAFVLWGHDKLVEVFSSVS